jgi:hypothetical protein
MDEPNCDEFNSSVQGRSTAPGVRITLDPSSEPPAAPGSEMFPLPAITSGTDSPADVVLAARPVMPRNVTLRLLTAVPPAALVA